MNNPRQHTALPWSNQVIRNDEREILSRFQHVAFVKIKQDADFIVHAVNNIERVEAELSRVKEVNERLDSGCKECANMIQALLPHSICAEEIRQRLISAIRDNAKLKEEAAKMKGDL